jgi:hypothetical protein
MSGKAYVRSAMAGFVLGVTLYAGGDVVNDILTFQILRSQASALANDDEELLEQIGSPLKHGPWYNSTIGFTHKGGIAQCTFQLLGSKQITDVNVKGIRGPGYASNLLYNTIGPGKWDLMMCTAMMPGGGGTVKPKPLMKNPARHSDDGTASGHEAEAEGPSEGPAATEATASAAAAGASSSPSAAAAAAAAAGPGAAGSKAQQQEQQEASSQPAAPQQGAQQGKTWWQWITRQ